MAKATITMDDLLGGDSTKQLVAGEMVTGHVLNVRKHEVLIDLGAQGVGFVPRREVGFSRQLNEGGLGLNRPDYKDVVTATMNELKSEIIANRDAILGLDQGQQAAA